MVILLLFNIDDWIFILVLFFWFLDFDSFFYVLYFFVLYFVFVMLLLGYDLGLGVWGGWINIWFWCDFEGFWDEVKYGMCLSKGFNVVKDLVMSLRLDLVMD